MRVTIFGTGYVGLVSGVCLAELGNDVVCVDIDPDKIERLNQGETPIYEPGLQALLSKNIAKNRIRFTTDAPEAIQHGLLIFIAVGTPSDEQGAADLSAVYQVATTIGEHMTDYALVLNKSTVPVGTADEVRGLITKAQQARDVEIEFDIASNPEFLREGAAINDFMNPDRIIVGTDTAHALRIMRELYTPLIDAGRRFIVMDTRSAELTKYAANAFLATKISFINEMSRIAEKVGADIEQVRNGMSMDHRIGPHFLNAGCGFGGSCFPKDVQALYKTAIDHQLNPKILTAVREVNAEQQKVLFQKINHYFNHDLQGKTVALWGLAFKPNTDDMRDASSLVLMEQLWAAGANVHAYDPVAMDNTSKLFGARENLRLCESRDAALQDADVLAIVTEWDEFKQVDLAQVKQSLRHPVIFDGRNIFEPQDVAKQEMQYYGIGRGERL